MNGEGQYQPPNSVTHPSKDAQVPQSNSRISAIPQNFGNTTRTLGPSHHSHEPSEHLKHLRTSATFQGPSNSGKSSTGWGKMVKTMGSSCRKLETPIVHHSPIPALGSLSTTVPLKSSTPPKAQ